MKRLLFTFFFLSCINNVMSQHYGGFTFTPYVMQGLFSDNNDGISSGSKAEKKSGFGYSAGYQGLIMPKKRFSFSYGFQYSDFYYEFYRKPQDIGFSDPPTIEAVVGYRQDFKALQIPLWWRYNILKNKDKWQPYLALSTTFTIPLTEHLTYYLSESSPRIIDTRFGMGLSLDAGAGMNYYHKNLCFSAQVTYSASYIRRLGLGMSVMRKF
jgi:hypothetical protein